MKLKQIEERENDLDASGNSRIDGIFGPLTHQDVIEFQGDTGLDPDGVVGPRTWNALDSLVTGSQDETTERELDARYLAAVEVEEAGRYDEALMLFEAIEVDQQQTPENANEVLYHQALCNQQRGRFGLAVSLYERGLSGRFNQEGRRGVLLEALFKARSNQFLDSPPPDPEAIRVGGENPGAYAGGGVRERFTARDGDSGAHVDLFKGKLTNVTMAWHPVMEGPEEYFEITTTGRTAAFQRACGLPTTGEADSATWHALDSFMPADVPLTVIQPILDEMYVAYELPDPAAAIAGLSAVQEKARALGLQEIVLQTDGVIGQRIHDLGDYEGALMRYETYLGRVFPPPHQLGMFMEDIRAAREQRPRPSR